MSDKSVMKIKSSVSIEIYRPVNSRSCRNLLRKRRNDQSINFKSGPSVAREEEKEFVEKGGGGNAGDVDEENGR